jgi:hypothetical protein
MAASGSRYIDVAGMPWQEPFPGIRTKVLYQDSEAKETMMLFETGPGTVIPEHVHGGSSGPSFSKAPWKTMKAWSLRATSSIGR